MVDFCEEADLGRGHGIVVGQEELELEAAALVRRLRGAVDGDIEVPQIVVVGGRRDALDGLVDQPFRLLDDALGQRHDACVRVGVCVCGTGGRRGGGCSCGCLDTGMNAPRCTSGRFFPFFPLRKMHGLSFRAE